jgi:acetyl/propionyl-CoA carboxylase alpha subunit/acetyl-CoA carboxylase carboxyltransferase component
MALRVAIVNRGEAAMRFLHTARELSTRAGETIETIALHTAGERQAMFVREADHAYDLGPAIGAPYLDHAVLERALAATGADAAWVGWGFVAEDPGFANLCERIGVTFIGPSAEAMRRLGDKISAKKLAESAGVPVAPWSGGPVEDLRAALAHARGIGYPLMLKAAAGGGGRGIRVVADDVELASVFDRTRDEARRAFGSDIVFLERLVSGGRHVEVQIIADGQGTAWAIGVRDCSIQRRNQKLIEESASPVLADEQVALLKEWAVRLALGVGYRGAGTVEFLYQPAERTFAFLEVNARLQVEHPVTEIVTATDIVALQLHIARGGRLEGAPPCEVGHAVEARLNAEDPDRDFAPAPGRIALLRLPVGPGVRVDAGVAEGDEIPADFDSMIAKIIAYAPTREIALARLERALADTTVVIRGGTTNKSFLLDLLRCPAVSSGQADTGWVDRERAGGAPEDPRKAGLAVIAAAINCWEEAEAEERLHFLAAARGGRPQARHEVGRVFDLEVRGTAHHVRVAQVGPGSYRISVSGGVEGDDATIEATMEHLSKLAGRLVVGDHSHRVVSATLAGEHQVEVDGSVHRITQGDGGIVHSPAPALVVSVPVAPGQPVTVGEPVIVLESMKMETVITAPFSGRLRDVLANSGDQVEARQPLLSIDPDDREPGAGAAAAGPADDGAASLRLALHELAKATADTTPLGELTRIRALFLGFDLAPKSVLRLIRAPGDHSLLPAGAVQNVLVAEIDALEVFADLCQLSRSRFDGTDGTNERVPTPRDLFHRYLHSLDPDRERLPEQFRETLARVLAHYGIDGLERSSAVEDAVLRVFLAQQRIPAHLPVACALLENWAAYPEWPGGLVQRVRDLLDRLLSASRVQYPRVADLVRGLRYRWFELPIAEARRKEVYALVEEHLTALADAPAGPDRAARIEGLTAIPEPIVRFLGQAVRDGAPTVGPLLEALARRQYYPHPLDQVRCSKRGERDLLTADYVLDHRPTRLVSTAGAFEDFGTLAELVQSAVDETTERQVVVDLYLAWDNVPVTTEECSQALIRLLDPHRFARSVRRAAVTVTTGHGKQLQRFTFRPGAHGEQAIREDMLVRGLHPMVGRRLDLWRLREFQISRLQAPDYVMLYRCVAPDNPSDVRLVALAQVRELTVLRDAAGNVTGLPEVERAVASCLDAIRRARAADPAGTPLDMNHVWIRVWAVMEDPEGLIGIRTAVAHLVTGTWVEEVVVQGRIMRPDHPEDIPREVCGRFFYRPGSGVVAELSGPPAERLKPIDDYAQKVVRMRRRGLVYPYEVIGLLTRGGDFVEHDLDVHGALVPVQRAPGGNMAGIVVGVVCTATHRYPEGLRRVVLLGDPTMALGAVAEPECARVIAALDLADRLRVPVEWFALSAGARISMSSGTENMDWVARALRRIIEFTQRGGEINVVVAGINVGAQPYWNAEATMLMHTRGILVMTPDSAMVLTGKQSLDYSGGVSAEDNFGIGGYDRVMGPNGQAQYWARDLADAVEVLFAHYDNSYVLAGEHFARYADTSDPRDRDVCLAPHVTAGSDFRTVGDIFSPVTNPERKKPFDIRILMRTVADADHLTMERWAGMADAETSIVLDAHLGGHPVCLIGIESRPIPRHGFPPSDGPDMWTAGTLFPRSSAKTARAINAASGSRPVVVLANLSGFDGSPESMRNRQLEYGAEIGRAIVNFDGPIVFCVISRYHGGAFVVFSKALHDTMTVLAIEGSYASVLGGAPAAAVVFSREVDARTGADPRVSALERSLACADNLERARLRAALSELRGAVRSEKLGEVAAEFDAVHSIERAVEVGSVDAVIPARELRPRLIGAVEAGLGGS